MKNTKKAVKAKKAKEAEVIEAIIKGDIEVVPPQRECQDCNKMVLEISIEKCPDCGMRVCPLCLSIHKEEHLAERYEEDEEEVERTNKPQWK